MKNYIAYYRVSTDKQGKSKLGLNSQQSTVQEYVNSNNGKILNEFIEVESGKSNNRTQLAKAIQLATDVNAVLIIAKLDRLSRNISFIFALRESKVNFLALDIPDMNTLTIGIFSTIAQYERELISERTKKALQEKKKQGFQLGNPDYFSNAGRLKGANTNKINADNNIINKQTFALIKVLKENGKSLRYIATNLNENGFKTVRNKLFNPTTVRNIYLRYADVS